MREGGLALPLLQVRETWEPHVGVAVPRSFVGVPCVTCVVLKEKKS